MSRESRGVASIAGARGHGASILVAALGSAFGVALLQITGTLTAAIRGDDVTGSSNTVALMLRILAFVFIIISVYVAAVVTANTFSTIVAGRVRSIALLRLLGSSASRERSRIAREGLGRRHRGFAHRRGRGNARRDHRRTHRDRREPVPRDRLHLRGSGDPDSSGRGRADDLGSIVGGVAPGDDRHPSRGPRPQRRAEPRADPRPPGPQPHGPRAWSSSASCFWRWGSSWDWRTPPAS